MGSKLMGLRNVPADELDDIHALLEQHEIRYYETSAGTFGISLPALWLVDDNQLPQARQLLDDYAVQRSLQAQARWQSALQAGTQRTLVDLVREHPLRFIGYAALIGALIYLSTVPFMLVARP